VVRADIASYEAVEDQFRRIYSTLWRLDRCTFIPEVTESFAKIMTHILSILALSIKAIKENRIGGLSFHSIRNALSWLTIV
jgi:hypothetical protein